MGLNLSEKALLKNIPMAVAVIQQDGMLLYSNKLLYKYLNTDNVFSDIFEITGKLLYDQKSNDKFKAEWLEVITLLNNKDAEDSLKREYSSINSQGEEKQYEFTIKILDENYIILIDDITEQKKIENELKKAKEQAEESDRLKTAFLQNMSHEVRTPLNGILGFSSLLNSPGLTNDEKGYYISVINESSNQLLSIVDNIINLSRLDTEKPSLSNKDISLNKLTDELYFNYMLKATNKGLELNISKGLSEKESSIKCDFDKLKIALENILDNAIKFTHNGNVNFAYKKQGHEVLFTIKDTGIGIVPEFRTKIFERFYQIDDKLTRNYGGTGLGLAVAKGNIELLEGKIWVESEYNKGTTFYVTIPYTPVYDDIHVKENSEQELFNSVKHFVLIAEDEKINFMFIEEALKGVNINLLHASNGKEAVEMFKCRDDISLVLMDIKMPIMDGYAALNEMKKIKPNIPIIAQTAYAFFSDKTKALQSGFNDYISKPIKKESLIRLVNEYITTKIE